MSFDSAGAASRFALTIAVSLAGCSNAANGNSWLLDAAGGDDGAERSVDATSRSSDGGTCPAEQSECNGSCVDTNTSGAHCGKCGNACADEELCTDGSCASLPKTCPAAGCPRGSYCDLGSNRCLIGCLGDDGCNAGQICEGRKCRSGCRADTACKTGEICDNFQCGIGCRRDADCGGRRVCTNKTCRCSSGTVDCGGNCVDTTTDKLNCGTCGTSCTDPTNGSGRCSNSGCTVTCNSTFHLCGTSCRSNVDPATCGNSCTPCPSPANGAATCDGTSCGVRCDSGYVASGNTCVRNCSATGCSGLTWCNSASGRCEAGCTRHAQCGAGQICYLTNHACVATVNNSCPAGYTFRGTCGTGGSICTFSTMPTGTTEIFNGSCPPGKTARGGYTCGGTTWICVPDN